VDYMPRRVRNQQLLCLLNIVDQPGETNVHPALFGCRQLLVFGLAECDHLFQGAIPATLVLPSPTIALHCSAMKRIMLMGQLLCEIHG